MKLTKVLVASLVVIGMTCNVFGDANWYRYSIQEVLNQVLVEDGIPNLNLHQYSTQAVLNMALDSSNGALRVNLSGGFVSGLNADLLDGYHGQHYRRADYLTHILNDARIPSGITRDSEINSRTKLETMTGMDFDLFVSTTSDQSIDGDKTFNDDIIVSTITARNSMGLSLLDDSNNLGIFLRDGGNVGIRNRVASYMLTVGTDTFTSGNGMVSPVPRLIMDNQYDDTGLPSINKWCFYNIDDTWVAGIGMSYYDFDLFSGNAGNFRFHTGTTKIDGTNSIERFTVLSCGNVGIFDTTPEVGLKVSSNAYITGGLGIGIFPPVSGIKSAGNVDASGYEMFADTYNITGSGVQASISHRDGAIRISSHIVVGGDLAIAGDMGSWFAVESSTDEALVLDAGVWTTLNNCNWVVGKLVNFTHSLGTATYTGENNKSFIYSFGITVVASPGNGTDFSYGVSKNGAAPIHYHTQHIPGNDEQSISCRYAVDLVQNNTIAIVIKTNDGDDLVPASFDFVVESK